MVQKYLLHSLLIEKEKFNDVSVIAKKVNVLQAVNWISQAYKNISSFTITKCFRKAGFPVLHDIERAKLTKIVNELKDYC